MMGTISIGLAAFVMGSAVGTRPDAHEANAVYASVIDEGLAAGGETFRLPEPTFTDDMDADQQREALRSLAGSDRAVEGLLRPSVTAPFLLSLRDEQVEGATIRAGDLFFALRVDLDAIDPSSIFGEVDGGPIEAGNMVFEAQVIDAEAVADAGDDRTRLVHTRGRLLDRIGVESTTRVEATRADDSVVVASRTDPRFDDHSEWPNRWWAIDRRGNSETTGMPQPYAGGVGYARLTRLKEDPETVLVELHFAFAEPTGWFNDAPILRSKFSLIAQDQVRKLRRELAQGQ